MNVRSLVPVVVVVVAVTAACGGARGRAPADAGTPVDGVDAGDADPGVVDGGAADPSGVGGVDGGTAANPGDAGSAASCGDGVVDGCTLDDSTGDYNCAIEHGGLSRSFILHVPASYATRPSTGAQLVLNFHGVRTTASLQRYFSKMNDTSDADGFVLVYPEGTGPTGDEGWNAGTCCDSAAAADVDDVGFSLAIIERVSSTLCIDNKRIYAAGLSNGGHMAYRLACEKADVFAAIASVAGVVTISPCAPSRPVPILHFHGTSDPVVNYYVGIDGVNGAQQTVDAWAARDSCSTTTDVVYQNGAVTCRANEDCSAGTDVELCTVDGGGHQWPGGNAIPLLGTLTNDISASDTIAAFFAAHAMP